jgi:hypothetical protein
MKYFATALVAAIACAQEGRISVDPSIRMLRDEHGRAVLFHGVNAVYKMPPYIPNMIEWSP